tara:strand:+ start:80 stop:775 length:696 start_codon:yes stop_codon:yes gene_type:complete
LISFKSYNANFGNILNPYGAAELYYSEDFTPDIFKEGKRFRLLFEVERNGVSEAFRESYNNYGVKRDIKFKSVSNNRHCPMIKIWSIQGDIYDSNDIAILELIKFNPIFLLPYLHSVKFEERSRKYNPIVVSINGQRQIHKSFNYGITPVPWINSGYWDARCHYLRLILGTISKQLNGDRGVIVMLPFGNGKIRELRELVNELQKDHLTLEHIIIVTNDENDYNTKFEVEI